MSKEQHCATSNVVRGLYVSTSFLLTQSSCLDTGTVWRGTGLKTNVDGEHGGGTYCRGSHDERAHGEWAHGVGAHGEGTHGERAHFEGDHGKRAHGEGPHGTGHMVKRA